MSPPPIVDDKSKKIDYLLMSMFAQSHMRQKLHRSLLKITRNLYRRKQSVIVSHARNKTHCQSEITCSEEKFIVEQVEASNEDNE